MSEHIITLGWNERLAVAPCGCRAERQDEGTRQVIRVMPCPGIAPPAEDVAGLLSKRAEFCRSEAKRLEGRYPQADVELWRVKAALLDEEAAEWSRAHPPVAEKMASDPCRKCSTNLQHEGPCDGVEDPSRHTEEAMAPCGHPAKYLKYWKAERTIRCRKCSEPAKPLIITEEDAQMDAQPTDDGLVRCPRCQYVGAHPSPPEKGPSREALMGLYEAMLIASELNQMDAPGLHAAMAQCVREARCDREGKEDGDARTK